GQPALRDGQRFARRLRDALQSGVPVHAPKTVFFDGREVKPLDGGARPCRGLPVATGSGLLLPTMATLARAAHWSCPPPLRPGDRVRIIAPSGPFDRALLLRGAGWLAERYRVEFDGGIFSRQGFLAGSDARRLGELDAALRTPELGAVISARGGYGLSRIVYQADLAALRRYPKWIVGFSDVTALHLEASRVGVMSMHAHNAAGLGRADATA